MLVDRNEGLSDTETEARRLNCYATQVLGLRKIGDGLYLSATGGSKTAEEIRNSEDYKTRFANIMGFANLNPGQE